MRSTPLQIFATRLRNTTQKITNRIRRTRPSDIKYGVFAKFKSDIHQTTATTAFDRYPRTFSEASKLLGRHTEARILSFGCSTGEEVLTLREYFPNAFIVGAELNGSRLKACRRKTNDSKIQFIKSSDANITAAGPFDMIFAMAVLQRTPHLVARRKITDLSKIYKFSQFNSQLVKLDANLRPGGIMILENTQYRFKDSDIFDKYDVCGHMPRTGMPQFDRNSLIIRDQEYTEAIFRKKTKSEPNTG